MIVEEQKSQQFFDRLAREGYWVDFEGEEALRVSECLELWELTQGDRILEPGCGRGRLTRLIAEKVGPSGEVVGVDISPEMIAGAKAGSPQANVGFLCRSVLNLCDDMGRFDKIVCCNVWPHFVRPREVLKKLIPCIKDGGDFWITHLCGRHKINEVHRNASPAVQDHLLPPARDLERFLGESGLNVLRHCDNAEMYWVHARK